MQEEIIPFQKQEFGDLVTLPDKVKAWKVETDNLRDAAERFRLQLPADLSALSTADLDQFDARLVKTITTIGGAFTRIESERKAGTAILDEIKAFSMLPEKSIAEYPGKFKAYRDGIAREKARRAREAEEARAKEIAKKQEAIEIRSKCEIGFNAESARQLNECIKKLNDNFYSKTLETIDEYESKLKAYQPNYTHTTKEFIAPTFTLSSSFHTPAEVASIKNEVWLSLKDRMRSQWLEMLTTERDHLIEHIPSRKRELEEIAKGNAEAAAKAKTRQEQEEKEREEAHSRIVTEQSQALQTAAEVDKTNAMFDAEASAEVVSMAKGTVVRKKYQPTTHKAFAALLQSWVSKSMPLLTMEELSRKLSFVLTAANERLNKGETIVGVDVVDDYSTRTSKKKEVAV